MNIPVDELRERCAELGAPGERQLVVYCEVGQRAHTAATLLAGSGHRVLSIDGGWQTWRAGQRSRRSELLASGR